MHNKLFIFFFFLLYSTASIAENRNIEKPKYLWFDAEANFKRFAYKDSISYYLEKAKTVGFNQVVVDVKPIYGKVLYNSKILPPLTKVNSKTIYRDWDYLQYFIDEAHRLGLKVTVSTAIFPAGHPATNEGLVYDDKRWDKKTCIEYMSDGKMIDIKNDKKKVAAFLNPVRKEVRRSALSIISEIVNNYNIDAYALDYCRYPGDNSDFSDDTRRAFEKYLGKKINNFPEDVFTWNSDGTHNPGMYYKEWWAFRANIITSFVKEVRDKIHSINKDVKLEYWAPSWIHGLYGQGQNWASPNSNFSLDYPWGSEAYNKEGFAPYLDTFLCGTYLERIYGMNDPESIEYGIARAKKLINNDCNVFGTIYALNHATNIVDAVSLCLEKSEGLMIFDIVQVIEMNLWDDIRKGIKQAEAQNIKNE